MAKGGGRWDFWFCSFGYFLGQFMCKKPWFFGFGVHCGLRIYWFLVFMKNTNGFSVLISNMIFGFSYLTYFIWFWFLLDLSSNYTPPLILLDANVLLRGMHDKPIEILQGSLGGSCILNDTQDFDHL